MTDRPGASGAYTTPRLPGPSGSGTRDAVPDPARDSASEPARRPNVLVILTDQLRWDHTGFGGNQVVQTPHLDRLAETGTVFERSYVTNPICMPSRASIFTGRMPSLHRVRANGIPLDPRQRTFSETLRCEGYRTGYLGKLHLQPAGERLVDGPPSTLARGDAWTTDDLPARWDTYEGWERHGREHVDVPSPFYGFEECDLAQHHGDLVHGDYERHWAERGVDIASLRGADNALPYTPVTQHAWRTAVPEEAYPTTYLADRAVESLGRYAASEDPFLLVLSFPDPHHPFTPPGRYWGMYDPADVPVPASFTGEHRGAMRHHAAAREARGEHLAGGPIAYAPDEAQLRHSMAAELGMISMLDDAIGRVLGELERLGLADDTVVVFTSDHGDMMGDHGLLFKVGCHWDGCVRVPLVIRAPGRTGVRCGALVSSLDISATVLDLCGVLPHAGMQGTSLVRQLDGTATEPPREAVLVVEDELFGVVDEPVAAIGRAAQEFQRDLGVLGSR
ncbi:MAG: sulfatase family protein, partial [Phycicoccus sp.]